jgi:hypothetical protein
MNGIIDTPRDSGFSQPTKYAKMTRRRAAGAGRAGAASREERRAVAKAADAGTIFAFRPPL